MRCNGIRLFDDEEMLELFELYRKYHRPADMSNETGISHSHCCKIYKDPRNHQFTSVIANTLKRVLTEFRERIGDENAANSEIKMDAFHNSHVITVFDKSNKEILHEALLKEVLTAVRKMDTNSLMGLYLDMCIESDEEKNEKEALR